MADNFIEFSFLIENVTQDEAEWLSKTHATGRAPIGPFSECFNLQIQQDGPEPDTSWFTDDAGQCNIEGLIDFLEKFLKKFRPTAEVYFEWARTCSKPKVGEFGGGAVLVTAHGCATRSSSDLQDILRAEING